MQKFEDNVRYLLANRKKGTETENNLTRAGVLMPIFFRENKAYFLLTLRTDRVQTHKGQISFPGGAREETDSDMLATALRETYEEVGIKPEDVNVLGELDDFVTVSDYLITPFAGIFPYPYPLKINRDEIVELIETPIAFFLNGDNLRTELRHHKGKNHRVLFYDYGRHTIWGVTAVLIFRFLDLLKKDDSNLLNSL